MFKLTQTACPRQPCRKPGLAAIGGPPAGPDRGPLHVAIRFPQPARLYGEQTLMSLPGNPRPLHCIRRPTIRLRGALCPKPHGKLPDLAVEQGLA